MRERKPVKFNTAYIGEKVRQCGKPKASICKEMGYANNYISNALSDGRMNETALRLLCTIIKADYGRALTIVEDAPDETSEITLSNLNELAEIVISYIQDVGKIQSDAIREIRETRTKVVEELGKMNKTLHDLDVFLRNEGAESRGFHKTVGNYLAGISSCMKIR